MSRVLCAEATASDWQLRIVSEAASLRHHALPSFPQFCREQLIRADGVAYAIRPICVDDAGKARSYCGLSAASRYSRLMYAVSEPSADFIDRMVHVDLHHSMAFVAVFGDGDTQQIIGVARYASAPGSAGCELRSPSRTNGNRVASALRSRVACWTTREQGIHHLDARILPSNSRMLGLAKWLGFVTARIRMNTACSMRASIFDP